MAKKVNKNKLGLGVRALLTNMDAAVKEQKPEEVGKAIAGSVAMIPVKEIEANPYQPRKDFEKEALNDLADSLKTHGLIQPITVRRLADRQYQLISGERRLRAAILAGLRMVPAYIRLVMEDREMMEMALIENTKREDLNVLEVAVTYERLINEFGLTHEQLSERLGKSRVSVTNMIRLLKLPDLIQKSIISKDISMGHARELAGVIDPVLQIKIFEQVLKKNLSVRATEKLVRSYREPAPFKRKEDASLPNDYKTVENNLKSYLGAKIALKLKPNGSGQISIPFNNTDELNRLLDLIEK